MRFLLEIKTIMICVIFLFSTNPILTTADSPIQHETNYDENTIIDLINQVNESQIVYYYEHLLEFGVRYTGTENCSKAGDWIYSEFENMQLEVEYHHWQTEGYESRNIIATLPGSDPSSTAEFIICAHYDTFIDSPGANDDGSGVVSILTIAKILSTHSFNHTIRFIAFSGEEVGTYGSYNYAKEAYQQKNNIIAVLNLDIIGFAETSHGGKILRYFHEGPSTWIAHFAQDTAKKYNNIIDMYIESLPSYPGADNQAFVDYGYDGVWIAQHDPNRVGHSPNDTFEHINVTYHKKVTKIMLAVLVEMAITPIPIQVIIRTPLEAMGYIHDNPIIELPFYDYYFQRLRGITIAIGRPIARVEVLCKDPVDYVVFSINDVFTYWDSDPPYEWEIQGKFYPLFGRHTLKASAYSQTGEYDVDEMDIIFFTPSYQYGKWF